MGIIFGTVPSPPDSRDFIYKAVVGEIPLPSSFMQEKGEILNQGDFPTCYAFAGAGIKNRQERINYPSRKYSLSPLFIVKECKKIDGLTEQEGSYPRCVMQILKDIGICNESTFPYSLMKYPLPSIPDSAYLETDQFKVGAYARIQTLSEIKTAICKNSPVLSGVYVTDSFLNPESGGFIGLPEGNMLGGHAIIFDGYDDDMIHTYSNGKTLKGFVRLPNSWGTSWGDGGHGYLPYDFFTYRNADLGGMSFFMEAWSSVDIILPPKAANKIEMWIDRNIAMVDGREVVIDQSPSINPTTGRTLLPVRFLSDMFGYAVAWDEIEKKVTLTKS